MHSYSYGKLCTEFYDLDKPEAPADTVKFYLPRLKEANGPALEPMCGSGRYLVAFLEQGVDIDGVDASPHMLQACRNKAARKGLKPGLYQQFLHELSLPRQYGVIIIPVGSFGLISEQQEVSDSLQRLHEHLLPGGRLILDLDTPRAQPRRNQTAGAWAEIMRQGRWGERWSGGWVTRSDGAKIVLSSLGTYDTEERLGLSPNPPREGVWLAS